MSTKNHSWKQANEEFLAELTEAAYGVALRHGLRGSFLDAELELWGALAEVLRQRGLAVAAAEGVEPALAGVA